MTIPRWFNKWASILLNLNMAGICVALTLVADSEWTRNWLWFVTGLLCGFSLFWLITERLQERSRQAMRDEMNAIGADIVRRMHAELGPNVYAPWQVSRPPDDEPPRMH